MWIRKWCKEKHSYRSTLLQWFAGIGVTLLAALFLSWIGVVTQIDSQFATLGFDADRISLLTSLLLSFLSSLCAAFLLVRCGPVWSGGMLLFLLRYVFPFLQQALHPGLGPVGQVQILIPGAFINILFTLFALGILFAGAGAAIGNACGQVSLVPLVTLGKHVFASTRWFQSSPSRVAPATGNALFSLGVGGLVASAVVLASLGTGSLLTYGPTTNCTNQCRSRASARPLEVGLLRRQEQCSMAHSTVPRWEEISGRFGSTCRHRILSSHCAAIPHSTYSMEVRAAPTIGFRQPTRLLPQMH